MFKEVWSVTDIYVPLGLVDSYHIKGTPGCRATLEDCLKNIPGERIVRFTDGAGEFSKSVSLEYPLVLDDTFIQHDDGTLSVKVNW